jgi:hypothetical protein
VKVGFWGGVLTKAGRGSTRSFVTSSSPVRNPDRFRSLVASGPDADACRGVAERVRFRSRAFRLPVRDCGVGLGRF